MSNKKNRFAHMTPEQVQQELGKMSRLQPMVSQWIEKTARAMLNSHLPTAHMQSQLEKDLRQKAEGQQVLNDPSLTVEDKVTLMVMLIMGKMDKEIETQAALVKAKTTAVATARDPSIDVETMKLKRMVDKRSHMFDTLRLIVERYNETATNVLRGLGR